ncbi:hypothetical protein DXG03_005149 [Asterophora parasitica]|uniref:Uncharacterized protein n=1 Tax=Asterophora parasitica TaxID=117018 RepID=A0A9P7KCQ3_9AGAR|nr:hypothetical protein DXG03_005149 [Asterophora parasitica]
MPGSEPRHYRTMSRGSSGSHARSPSPPTLTYHPTILPLPTPALVESVAGAAHYSGIKLDHETSLHRRRSSHEAGDVHTELKESHKRVLKDLRELYECRPTTEIFERSWNVDAEFESQQYTARLFKHKKTVNSIIIVDLDDDEKIIRLVDQWDGKDLPTRFGAHFLRVLNAKLAPWLISVPKRRTS